MNSQGQQLGVDFDVVSLGNIEIDDKPQTLSFVHKLDYPAVICKIFVVADRYNRLEPESFQNCLKFVRNRWSDVQNVAVLDILYSCKMLDCYCSVSYFASGKRGQFRGKWIFPSIPMTKGAWVLAKAFSGQWMNLAKL